MLRGQQNRRKHVNRPRDVFFYVNFATNHSGPSLINISPIWDAHARLHLLMYASEEQGETSQVLTQVLLNNADETPKIVVVAKEGLRQVINRRYPKDFYKETLYPYWPTWHTKKTQYASFAWPNPRQWKRSKPPESGNRSANTGFGDKPTSQPCNRFSIYAFKTNPNALRFF
ncbi:hypothetical protein VNO77_30573 [Canavalia gladiata]|uniref:Uncharacterized protein n=1 Tax=Canavalia gladiata TaxID=3824 RepID=A0AAN9Q1F5_CANGL